MDALNDLQSLIPIMLFLLPGFITVALVEMLVISKPKDVFDRIIQALLFTCANLITFYLLRLLLEFTASLAHFCLSAIPSGRFSRDPLLTPGNISLTILCALIVGLAWAYELTNEKLLQWLRDHNFTKKTAKPSTWQETFSLVQKMVVVHLEDGRRIYGWPRLYSDAPDERAIFLEEASWLNDSNELINKDKLISVFLDKHSGIKLIEFIDPDEPTTNDKRSLEHRPKK